MESYLNANPEIISMIERHQFDSQKAASILNGEDLNTPVLDSRGFSTTYLYMAVGANDLQAVRFFLEHGADPNYYNPKLTDDFALWDLQYIDDDQDWRTRYEIGKLFFQHGANPNVECDGEGLYDYVLYKVYNETPNNENDWENLRHLYLLLVLYGGGNDEKGYPLPVLKDVDLSKIDKYDIRFYRHEDGYHIIGELVDDKGISHGRL